MTLSKWLPESSPQRAAALGKLTEEVGELAAILGRCAAQGVDGIDPDTGKPNITALEEEIADVRALSVVVINLLRLDPMRDRMAHKIQIKTEWLEQVPK